jgi:lysozyme
MPTIYEQLRLHEGERRFPYQDTVGKTTIGVGRNLTDRGLSPDEIDFLLTNDVNESEDACAKAFPWFYEMNHVRRNVLIDMCFNLGLPRLLRFKKFLGYLKAADYLNASKEMLKSTWAKQVGRRATRLADMMMTGTDYVN